MKLPIVVSPVAWPLQPNEDAERLGKVEFQKRRGLLARSFSLALIRLEHTAHVIPFAVRTSKKLSAMCSALVALEGSFSQMPLQSHLS